MSAGSRVGGHPFEVRFERRRIQPATNVEIERPIALTIEIAKRGLKGDRLGKADGHGCLPRAFADEFIEEVARVQEEPLDVGRSSMASARIDRAGQRRSSGPRATSWPLRR